MKIFTDKKVFITGAASGIGKALANEFAKEGAQLLLNDHNPKELEKTRFELESHVLKTYCFDVSKRNSFLAVSKEIEEQFGGVDIVINNAGVALGKLNVEETSFDEFEWLMNINFWGVVNGTKAFLSQLKNKKNAVLVNVSSLFGLIGVKYQSAYCSSKYAVRGFTESLMAENRNKNFQIHVVHPGGVNTKISLNARGGDPKYNIKFHDKFLQKNSPEKAAKIIINGIKKNKQRIIIGNEAYAGDYASRLLPIRLINFIQKYFHKDLD